MFDWDAANLGHIADHGVSLEEVEEVFADTRRVSVEAYNTSTERRWAIVGSSDDERVLFVVYTRRDGAIRVVTARDASPTLVRRYRRK